MTDAEYELYVARRETHARAYQAARHCGEIAGECEAPRRELAPKREPGDTREVHILRLLVWAVSLPKPPATCPRDGRNCALSRPWRPLHASALWEHEKCHDDTREAVRGLWTAVEPRRCG